MPSPEKEPAHDTNAPSFREATPPPDAQALVTEHHALAVSASAVSELSSPETQKTRLESIIRPQIAALYRELSPEEIDQLVAKCLDTAIQHKMTNPNILISHGELQITDIVDSASLPNVPGKVTNGARPLTREEYLALVTKYYGADVPVTDFSDRKLLLGELPNFLPKPSRPPVYLLGDNPGSDKKE